MPTPEDLRAQMGAVAANPMGGMAMKQTLQDAKAFVAQLNSLKSTSISVKNMSEGMNKSFQGMQGKASVIQKVIGGIMDGFAVGVEKWKKDFVGALKKGIVEGDVAGMVQGLIDMKYQFVEFSRLNQPFIEVFKPFNQMLSAVAGYATKAVVGSKEFRDFITNLGTESGMKDLMDLGNKLGDIVLRIVNMDWDKAINGINGLLDGLQRFTDFVDNWNSFWNPQPKPGTSGSNSSNPGLWVPAEF